MPNVTPIPDFTLTRADVALMLGEVRRAQVIAAIRLTECGATLWQAHYDSITDLEARLHSWSLCMPPVLTLKDSQNADSRTNVRPSAHG